MKEHTLTLQVLSNKVQQIPTSIVQNDSDTNVILISLVDATNKPYSLGTITSIGCKVLKENGNIAILGTSNVITTDWANGKIKVTLPSLAVSQAGVCQAVIEFYDTGRRVTTARFSYLVTADIMGSANQQIDVDTAIQLTTLTQNAMGQFESFKTTAQAAESTRVGSENTRVANESSRSSSESTRSSNESTRIANESTRVSNEIARANAENTRISKENARIASEETRNTAEATRLTSETARINAESTRVSNEDERKNSELLRKQDENSREIAELNRKTSEYNRNQAELTRQGEEAERLSDETQRVARENARVANESDRVLSEDKRKENESARVTAENNRVNTEATRVSNETTRENREAIRVSNESTRVSKENARVTSETARASAESTRATSETARINAESTRSTNETGRVSSETTRASNEAARVNAEAGRATTFNAQVATIAEKTTTSINGEQSNVNFIGSGGAIEEINISDKSYKFLDNTKIKRVVLKNKVLNPNFDNSSYFPPTLATIISVANNELTFKATAKLGQVKQSNIGSSIAGHIYYAALKVKATSNLVQLDIRDSAGNPILKATNSGSGEFEYLSFQGVINKNDNIQFRVMDNRVSGWDNITIKEAVFIDLTECFGESVPDIKEIENAILTYNNNSYFFASEIMTDYVLGRVLNNDIQKKSRLYVKIYNNTIDIISKYSKTEDLRITMCKKGVNNIFDFYRFYKIINSSLIVSMDLNPSSVPFYSSSSDWFAPYKVSALNNGDGDNINITHFTGGNHGYDNTGSIENNTPTGRTVSLKFRVDGRQVDEYEGYCDIVEIYWENMIQANNTKKEDGTGREVLKEIHNLIFDGYKVKIENTIEFLESCIWRGYYGLQCQRGYWGEGVLYRSSSNRKWILGNVDSDSIDKECNVVSLKNQADGLDICIDKSFDLGKSKYLTKNSYNAFSTSTKSYFWLVDESTTVEAGDTFGFKGYYKFYPIL